MSLRLRLLNLYLRHIEKPRLAKIDDPEPQRANFERQARWFFRTVPGVVTSETELTRDDATVPAVTVRPVERRPRAVLLYLHGGAYVLGSAQTHARLGGALARAIGVEAVLPDYRLAPEHPYPAALDDAETAYHALLEQGYTQIVLAGDSAGGGLAFALLARVLETALPCPVCVMALSPWTDLALTGDSYRTNHDRDVMLPAHQIERCAAEYLGGAKRKTPGASPLYADLTGAPPTLIQLSRAEALMDDGLAMAAKLEAVGVDVLVQSWDDTPHVWQIFHGLLPEADEAITALARFAKLHLARA